eukprot:365834-Chlamydomonas_euryale.AAC.2
MGACLARLARQLADGSVADADDDSLSGADGAAATRKHTNEVLATGSKKTVGRGGGSAKATFFVLRKTEDVRGRYFFMEQLGKGQVRATHPPYGPLPSAPPHDFSLPPSPEAHCDWQAAGVLRWLRGVVAGDGGLPAVCAGQRPLPTVVWAWAGCGSPVQQRGGTDLVACANGGDHDQLAGCAVKARPCPARCMCKPYMCVP